MLVGAASSAEPVRAPHISAELLAEDNALVPGQTHWLALRLAPDPHWHTYWINPGDSGLATRMEWTLPAGLSAGEIHWPAPEQFSLGDIVNYGYGDTTLHLVPLTVSAELPIGTPVEIIAKAHWLVCADICIPGSAELTLRMPVAGKATSVPAVAAAFADARALLPQQPPLSGQYEIGADTVQLQIDTRSISVAAGEPLHVYPQPNTLINHSAQQRQAREAGQLRISQRRSDYFETPPPLISGVLVAGSGAQRQAWAFNADAGSVPAVAAGLPAGGAHPDHAVGQSLGLLTILGFAFIGGLILNLMPCVLPVLAIKGMSLVQGQSGASGEQRRQTLVYALGVVLSCLAIAAALLAARAAGEAAGWGFQLQSPVVVSAMAYLFFVLGLSLSGLVDIGSGWMGMGQQLTERGGLSGSFFTGVLAVVVASPCTAPFMGTALGYAMTQNAAIALLVFATLGLGLAAPFLIIGLVPGAARWIPKPGAWMEGFKQFMAFPLYLTVVWLIWVLGRQAGANAVAVIGSGLVLLALSLWIWTRRPAGERGWLVAPALVIGVLALGLLAAPQLKAVAATNSIQSEAGVEPYSDQRLAELRAAGHTVFVNMTADWCISCLANERVALSSEAVAAAFELNDVKVLKGDWTNGDPAITAVLERHGRNGVPLYLVYAAGAEARILPQILTPGIVVNAVQHRQ